MSLLAGVPNVSKTQRDQLHKIAGDARIQIRGLKPAEDVYVRGRAKGGEGYLNDEGKAKADAMVRKAILKMRAVLTPDQLPQFDANVSLLRKPLAPAANQTR